MTRTTLPRQGSILPFVTFLLLAIVIFVALAIDVGLMVLSRNHAQIAADVGAMAGVRQLDGITNDAAKAEATAELVSKSNKVLGQVGTVAASVGTYYYDKVEEKFIHIPLGKPADNPDEAWSAVQVEVKSTQPAYFSRVIGFNSYDVSAKATSVHRPRDVAIILDFSGSMRFSSTNSLAGSSYASGGNNVTNSLNPDPGIPNFGHWASYQQNPGRLRRTTSIGSAPYKFAASNWTMDSADNGPAVVKDFYYDSSNDPAQSTAADTLNPGNLKEAFHNPVSPWDKTLPITMPAPSNDEWRDQTDATYVGDLWPRLNPTDSNVTAATATLTNSGQRSARTVKEFLNGNNDYTYDPPAPTSLRHAKNHGATGYPGVAGVGLWEESGYDMVGGGTFKGYSMGPGYYGKTFFIWPPDPRTPTLNLAPTDAGYVAGDWRKRFFHYPDNSSNRMDDNSRLFDSNGVFRNDGSTTYEVDYARILAWIKQEPRTLPPNLRAGRILYYKHIPDDVDFNSGSADVDQDKRFWKAYIDYVIGCEGSPANDLYGQIGNAYNGSGTVRITAKSSLTGPDGIGGNADDPYMNYRDLPRSPLLHFWFGPLSMMDFIMIYNRSWVPGTVHEAQSWQMKAGVNSALSDIEKNHPNDWVSLIYYSALIDYATARVSLGKEYPKMKNALFFPIEMVNNGTISTQTTEWRPYNNTFGDRAQGKIPHADGSTCPEMGLRVAYNQFSGPTAGFNGRKGATKFVILETDGVPNTTASGSFSNNGPYKSYYNITGSSGASQSAAGTAAVNVVTRIAASDTAANPGYTIGNAKARVHSLAFGDLFDDPTQTDAAAALTFLYNVQVAGNTSSSPIGDTKIEPHKVITGDYATRIDNLRTALERIMQSGVQVTLIKGTGEYILP